MSFDESMESIVTRKEAMREVRMHSCDWADFVAECGDADIYLGSVILNWLGY